MSEFNPKDPYEIGPGECPNCYATGSVAVGRWGARPEKGTCPECKGTGRIDDEEKEVVNV